MKFLGNMEPILVASVSALSISVFFSQSGIDIFGLISLLLLLIWRFSPGYRPARQLPQSLIIIAAIFLLNRFISALISTNRADGLRELVKYWEILLGGLLFTCPMSNKNRMKIIAVFLLGAFFSGLTGIFQHYGMLFKTAERADGNTHPIYYAGILAFPCASAIMLLLSRDSFGKSLWRRLLIMAGILASLGGIVFSQSRGVWVAVFASCLIILFLYDRRKARIFIFSAVPALILIFSLSGELRQRATSIITSIYSEDYRGSTGNRLELWKGALMIYEKAPVFGTGVGGWDAAINRLIAEGRIKPVPVRCEAHNMFLQTLSTQGTVGFIILMAFIFILIRWGKREIMDHGGIGGYIIIWSTLLVIIGGLTENCIGLSKYLAAYCLTLGLMGGYLSKQECGPQLPGPAWK